MGVRLRHIDHEDVVVEGLVQDPAADLGPGVGQDPAPEGALTSHTHVHEVAPALTVKVLTGSPRVVPVPKRPNVADLAPGQNKF